MGRVIKEFDYEQEVAGIPVLLRELIWDDGGRSWEVFRVDGDEEIDLTEDGCFDERPGEEMILTLLAPPERWICPGCGTPCDPGSDVIDHVRWCRWVDGAGRPIVHRGA